MWTIRLDGSDKNKQIAYNIWGKDYFPRMFKYKSDANRLLDTLAMHGIKASIRKGIRFR